MHVCCSINFYCSCPHLEGLHRAIICLLPREWLFLRKADTKELLCNIELPKFTPFPSYMDVWCQAVLPVDLKSGVEILSLETKSVFK